MKSFVSGHGGESHRPIIIATVIFLHSLFLMNSVRRPVTYVEQFYFEQ